MKKIKQKDILLVARRWTQRGEHTEFNHFLKWFPKANLISTDDAIQSPYVLLKKIADRAKQDGYTSYSFGIELAAIFYMIKKRPKLVIFWYGDHEYRYSWWVAKLLRIKIIGNFFFSIDEFQRRMPNKNHLKHLNLITTSGHEQSIYLSKAFPNKKISYVPLGVDTNFYKPPENNGAHDIETLILHVGYNRRDFDTLRKVFEKILKSMPNAKMEMVTALDAKSKFEDLENVYCHPFIEDDKFLSLYHKATLLLLPLLEGGSSQTLNEAMSTGLPIVTNSMPNLEDYYKNSGVLLSESGDVDTMANHCIKIINDKNERAKISIKLRKHALKFDFENSRKKLYQSIEQNLNFLIDN